jgi:Flp pilus assembly pilin Flp
MLKTLKALWNDDEAQDLVEYALLIVLISLLALASISSVGHAVSNVFSNAAANLTTT